MASKLPDIDEVAGEYIKANGHDFDLDKIYSFCNKLGLNAVPLKDQVATKIRELNPMPTGNVLDILKYKIQKPDRFGCGIKHGKPYYGVLVGSPNGEPGYAVFYNGQLIYGKEMMQAAGFNLPQEIFADGEETWNTQLLDAYARKPRKAKSTKELIDDIAALNKRVAWINDEKTYIANAAYILATYIFIAFHKCPRMVVVGMPDSGKTTQTNFMAALSLNPMSTADASQASLFRTIESMAGTVVVDNFDKIANKEVVANFVQLFDTSWEDTSKIHRIVEEKRKKKPVAFRTFCPMIVNCTSSAWMGESSVSRAIFVRMIAKSRLKLERLESIDPQIFKDLRHELRIWGLAKATALASMTGLEDNFSNRDADLVRPLLAILKDAGEEYYKQGIDFLKMNFSEHHSSDEFSEQNLAITALWDVLMLERKAGMDVEQVYVQPIAERMLHLKGIEQVVDGRTNREYQKLCWDFCNYVGRFLKTMPYERVTRISNHACYYFNIRKMARYLKEARRIDIGKEGEELLQGSLEGVN